MVELGSITGLLKLATSAWGLVAKAIPLVPKREAPQVYDEAGFLALIDPRNIKPVRHIDTKKKHYFQFKACVDEIEFHRGSRWNIVHFYFPKPEHESDLGRLMNRQYGIFGNRLRPKAEMLRQGDQITITGYFTFEAHPAQINITDIQRI